jgi:hypothetical protein
MSYWIEIDDERSEMTRLQKSRQQKAHGLRLARQILELALVDIQAENP